MSGINSVFLIVFVIVLFKLLGDIFSLCFSLQNYRLHKKRLKQLTFGTKKNDDISELIDKLTKPVIKNIIPKIKIKNLEEIEKELRMAQWDNKMNATQYVALNFITKALAIIIFLLLFKPAKPMAFVWGFMLFFSLPFILKNSVKSKKEKLMMEFPDFIRICESYLVSGLPFVTAVKESIQFIGPEWQPILRNFVVEAKLNNIDSALKKMAQESDIFEVKEFISLVKLTIDQGGDASEGFESQAEEIQDMLYEVSMVEIEKRKTIGTLLHFPLWLCILMALGLPTLHAMISMNTM